MVAFLVQREKGGRSERVEKSLTRPGGLGFLGCDFCRSRWASYSPLDRPSRSAYYSPKTSRGFPIISLNKRDNFFLQFIRFNHQNQRKYQYFQLSKKKPMVFYSTTNYSFLFQRICFDTCTERGCIYTNERKEPLIATFFLSEIFGVDIFFL